MTRDDFESNRIFRFGISFPSFVTHSRRFSFLTWPGVNGGLTEKYQHLVRDKEIESGFDFDILMIATQFKSP